MPQLTIELPYDNGKSEVFTQGVGDDDPSHTVGTSLYYAVDFDADRYDVIRSVADGVVLDVYYAAGDGEYGINGYGNIVTVDYGSFVVTYGHLDPTSERLSVGADVPVGSVIGLVGETGVITGTHIHLTFAPANTTKIVSGVEVANGTKELTEELDIVFDAASGEFNAVGGNELVVGVSYESTNTQEATPESYPDIRIVEEDGDIRTTTFDSEGRRETFTFEDGSNTRGWAEYTYRYDQDGEVVTTDRIFDDGRTIRIAYEDGLRRERVLTEADGDKRTTTYGPDAIRDNFVAEDISGSRNWSQNIITYDENGDRTQQTRVYDNGGTTVTSFADGTRSQKLVTDADGDLKTTIYGLDGKRDTFVFQDVSDSRAWSEYTNEYDDDGTILTRTRVFDDGSVFLTEYEDGRATSTVEITPEPEPVWTLTDDFEDGVLSTEGWTYTHAVSEFDGSLHLEMAATDQQSTATITFDHSLTNMTLSYDVFLHAANAYFYGRNFLQFRDAEGQEFDVLFNTLRTSWGPGYENDPDNFDLPRMVLINPDDGNKSVYSTGSNTSSYFDEWTRIEIEFDSNTGIVGIDMESDGATDLFIQDERLVGATAEAYMMGTYGWWTGHYTKIDELDLVGVYIPDELAF